MLSVADRLEESLAALERAEAVAAAIPDPSDREALAFRGGMLSLRGMNHALLGDEAGLDEIREGLRLSIEAGASNRAGNASANLAEYVNVWQGPREAAHDVAQGIAFAKSRGLKGHVATHQLIDVMLMYDLGEHDRLLAAAPHPRRGPRVVRLDRRPGGPPLEPRPPVDPARGPHRSTAARVAGGDRPGVERTQ